MSVFDKAFARSDAAALAVMGEDITVWKSGSSEITIKGSVSPPEIGGKFGMAGKIEQSSLEAEVSESDVRVNGIEDGWKLRWKSRNFLIDRLAFNGDTVTLICGAWTDASGE